MSAEVELLTKCLGPTTERDLPNLVNWAESHEVDWDKLIGLARTHGIIAQVFLSLRPIADQLPEETRRTLKRDYHVSIGRNVFVASELGRIIGLLRSEGIEVIPYKGPVLSDILFGQSAVRESKDIDLVVRRRDIRRARDVLLAGGYQQDVELSEREETFLMGSRKESSYDLKLPYQSGKGKRLKVELHWRLPLTSDVPADWYWEDLESYNFNGETVSVFPMETLLLILLSHGFRHYWESLKWLSDIDLLIRGAKDISWDRFLSLSEKLGVRRVSAFGLLLSQSLLKTPLPRQIQTVLSDEALVQKLIPGAVENMSGKQRCPVGVANNILIRERFRDRLFYFRNLFDYVFLPEITDYRRFPLPRILWPIYWFVRPFKVLVCVRHKYGLQRLGRLFVGKTGE